MFRQFAAGAADELFEENLAGDLHPQIWMHPTRSGKRTDFWGTRKYRAGTSPSKASRDGGPPGSFRQGYPKLSDLTRAEPPTGPTQGNVLNPDIGSPDCQRLFGCKPIVDSVSPVLTIPHCSRRTGPELYLQRLRPRLPLGVQILAPDLS